MEFFVLVSLKISECHFISNLSHYIIVHCESIAEFPSSNDSWTMDSKIKVLDFFFGLVQRKEWLFDAISYPLVSTCHYWIVNTDELPIDPPPPPPQCNSTSIMQCLWKKSWLKGKFPQTTMWIGWVPLSGKQF